MPFILIVTNNDNIDTCFDKFFSYANDQYQHASMIDFHEFHVKWRSSDWRPVTNGIKTHGPQLEGITSLEFLVSPTTTIPSSVDMQDQFALMTLPYLLPSLRELNLTNSFGACRITDGFFENCPYLENFTYSASTRRGHKKWLYLSFVGSAMKAAHNLKDLNIDDLRLFIHDTDYLDLADQRRYLLSECGSKVLERVSMRNTKMYVDDFPGPSETFDMPHNLLIEFIRNAPTTLRWFRSNLTAANIEIVQHERPEIEFVS